NDQASLPQHRFPGLQVYDGWWLCEAGTTLAADVADATSTTMQVSDASTLGSNLLVMVETERMLIQSMSATSGPATLTVQRGFNSTAAAHPAGAMVRPHAPRSNPSYDSFWLNVTDACPPDPRAGRATSGLTWRQYLAQYVAGIMAAHAQWDGVFLDDMGWFTQWLDDGAIDADGDNVADGGAGWIAGLAS